MSVDFRCIDCRVDTSENLEYYMVHDHIWRQARGSGMLCIGCLENRLGRSLRPRDFTDCLLNSDAFRQSPRLRDRLGYPL